MAIDLRIRIDSGREVLCLEALTVRARHWIGFFVVPSGGRWLERSGRTCYWTLPDTFPFESLRDSDLTVVIGSGGDGERSADPWLGRREEVADDGRPVLHA